MTVTVADIRSRTYMLDVTGRTLASEVAFAAQLTPVCVAPDDRHSIETPTQFRQALERYRDACAAGGKP